MNNPLKRPEQRKAKRFAMAVPVELLEGTGITRDLSVCGVFFETDRVFLTGETIQLTLILEYLDPRQPVRLQCQGHIVRIEPHGSLVGVAVAIEAYCFAQADSRSMKSRYEAEKRRSDTGQGGPRPWVASD